MCTLSLVRSCAVQFDAAPQLPTAFHRLTVFDITVSTPPPSPSSSALASVRTAPTSCCKSKIKRSRRLTPVTCTLATIRRMALAKHASLKGSTLRQPVSSSCYPTQPSLHERVRPVRGAAPSSTTSSTLRHVARPDGPVRRRSLLYWRHCTPFYSPTHTSQARKSTALKE